MKPMKMMEGAQSRADDLVRDVLRTQWQGVTAVRLDSPPGAGKTGVVERLAVQSLALLRERCMSSATRRAACSWRSCRA